MTQYAAAPGDSAFERQHRIRIVTPSPEDVMRANIAAALALDLPPLSVRHRGMRSLAIIANGPSATSIPTDAAAKIGDTLAVNGALRVARARFLAPTYWLTLDPQALVADFVAEPPASTTYLLPSHAAPEVFAALAGRKIEIWHAACPVSQAALPAGTELLSVGISSTLAAIAVGAAIGYRRIIGQP
jgi:hypothetical protein